MATVPAAGWEGRARRLKPEDLPGIVAVSALATKGRRRFATARSPRRRAPTNSHESAPLREGLFVLEPPRANRGDAEFAMMRKVRLSVVCGVLAATGAAAVMCERAEAAPPPYSLVGSFPLPGGPFDVLPDGRVMRLAGSDIYVQSSVNGTAYTRVGSVSSSLINSFGASFLKVSPNGQTIAIGDNNFGPDAGVLLVSTASLSTGGDSPTTSIAVPNTEATWSSNSTLFVTGYGSQSVVSRLDVGSLSATTVIDAVGGGSAGVTTHGAYLFAADGFNTSDGGEPTGNVRAFSLAALTGSATSVDFSSGVLVADALSGSSLGFDALGNMLVGGGDFFAGSDDYGYGAIIEAAAISAALLGGPLAPDSSELRLSPAGTGGVLLDAVQCRDKRGAGGRGRDSVPILRAVSARRSS